MLTDLTIRNLAIIESLHVPFSSGLNILTGETGAGKSIIIDAVSLLLGSRGGGDMVRTGCDEAVVEAIFDLRGQVELRAAISAMGIDCEDELLVRRVVSASGKGRAFVNGGLVTLSMLGEITRRLVNIYGQHESQTLLRVENHLHMLDGFAGLGELRDEFATLHRRHRGISEELRQLEEGERDALRRIDILAYQVEEIAAAALVHGEEERLEQERNLLGHAEKLLSRTEGAYDTLYGGDRALLGSLRSVESAVAEAVRIDPSLQGVLESISSAYLQLEDASLSLRDYAAGIDSDPERVQAVDDRLESIRRLKKKYGSTIAEILECHSRMERELASLQGREESRGDLEQRLAEVEAQMLSLGSELGRRRKEAAARMEKSLEGELQQLALKHARIDILVEPLEKPRETGFERVEFLFSPNPGEAAKPLAKIASGGELSRIMLAVKQLHPESDVPTLIFDEVDTGIGGATSAMVGKKLRSVAARQQVLCITHLPQVAAHADSHYLVAKHLQGARTSTEVNLLDDSARVEEVARMLGALVVTDTSRDHARELILDAAAGRN